MAMGKNELNELRRQAERAQKDARREGKNLGADAIAETLMYVGELLADKLDALAPPKISIAPEPMVLALGEPHLIAAWAAQTGGKRIYPEEPGIVLDTTEVTVEITDDDLDLDGYEREPYIPLKPQHDATECLAAGWECSLHSKADDPSWQQEWEPADPDAPIILCDKPECNNPAIVNLVPEHESDMWIHQYCWPCAKTFYTAHFATRERYAGFTVAELESLAPNA